ncbi:hypothetical protein POKO110462_21870 [Pontibacter korlensis]|uniref:hypothetical protein n=1 Tax=Pontibacter korlensis TaxID=400092 RepID=UPI000695B5BC|nr:hypothetical protein [Pontibacter korlensis]
MDHSAYAWQYSSWRGLPFKDLVLYELHVGTFTREGMFEAVIPLLDNIAETGINAIELLPVSQFSSQGAGTGAMTASTPMPCRHLMEDLRD